MGQFLENVQYKLKTSSTDIINLVLKIFSGLLLGLTFAIVGQEILGYGTISFVLVIVVTTLALLRVAKSWRIAGVLVFDLILVLTGLLLRMYIQIAPGV